jgi:hypothetical protein
MGSRLSPRQRSAFDHLGKMIDRKAIRNFVEWPLAGRVKPAMINTGREVAAAVLNNSQSKTVWLGDDCACFPERFISAHIGIDDQFIVGNDLLVTSIATKHLFWPLVILACGADNKRFWFGLTVPGLRAGTHWGEQFHLYGQEIELLSKKDFVFDISELNKSLRLLVVNYPHTLSGKSVDANWWSELCEYAQKNDLRIVNWGSLISRNNFKDSLAATAINFPNLSWIECYSLTEIIDSSWSATAIIGSKDFVADMAVVSELHNEPLFIPAAAGIVAATSKGRMELEQMAENERRKIEGLAQVIAMSNLRIASMSENGYFTLWHPPEEVAGEKVARNPYKFNQVMLEKFGIDGLFFKNYVGYSAIELDSDVKKWAEPLLNVWRNIGIVY